jgi:hypothetical protein
MQIEMVDACEIAEQVLPHSVIYKLVHETIDTGNIRLVLYQPQVT